MRLGWAFQLVRLSHQSGGIARHEAPTRRRHTPGRLRVVHNPHRRRCGERRRGRGRAAWCAHGPPATRPRRSQAVVPPALAAPVAVGVLYYTKPSGGVSPACRSLMLCNSPRLVALRAWCWLVWCPQCRPPWQTPVTTNCCRRGGPRCGHNSVCRGVLLAGEHIIPSTHPIYRMVTG